MPEDSSRREEAQDFLHDPLSLIGLKEELRMRGAIKNNHLFGFTCLCILRPNLRQPRSVGIRVVPGDDELKKNYRVSGGSFLTSAG